MALSIAGLLPLAFKTKPQMAGKYYVIDHGMGIALDNGWF
jgi:hypothetical protein